MKQKRNIIIGQLKLPGIAFAAVGALYLIYFALFGFYPFGERSIAWCDLEQQYVPLLMELRASLKDSGSLFLGKGGGGMNLWGVILFFVSSPLNLLSLFVKADKMIHFINILTVLKLSLCGASASYYFRRIFGKLSPSFNILLSVAYSFSGYVMMYYQNNMWLDMVIVFPLLLLSMFRLCESGRWKNYCIMLSLSMILNFYISYMVVLFIVIAFGGMLIFCCEKENRGNRSAKFLTADICAALMTAVVWIPSLKQFSSSGRGESVLEVFSTGYFFEDFADKLALLCCTSVIFAAAVILIFRRELFKSGRAAFFAVFMILLLAAAFVSPINKVWHTGSYQAYPLRYGFIIILLGLSVTAVLLSEINHAERKKRFRLKWILPLTVYIAAAIAVLVNSSRLTSYIDSLWVKNTDAAAAAAMGLLGAAVYGFYITGFRKGRLTCRAAAVLMGAVFLCETLLSFSIYIGNTRDVTARFKQTVELSGKIEDEDFYRVKSMQRYFYSNMLEAMGFSSIGHYTSLTDSEFLFGAKKMGYSAYWLDISTNGGTLVTDAFLMNKYIFGQTSDMNSLYEPCNTEDALKIYRNTVVSDGAVISDASPDELEGLSGVQRAELSAYMAKSLYRAENVMKKAEPYAVSNLSITETDGRISVEIIDDTKEAYISYSLFAQGQQALYFDLFSNYSTALREPYFESVSVYVNGKFAEGAYPNKRENGILNLGVFEDSYVSVKVEVHSDFSVDEFGVYLFDAKELARSVTEAETGEITLDGSRITISAESRGEQWLYIPFAYSGGFRAEINGSDTKIYKALGSFMAVKLQNGENNIVLSFCPEGFAAGAAVSLAGVLLFAAMTAILRRKRIAEGAARASEKTVFIMSTAVFAVTFILSVIVWIIMQFI